MNKIFFIITLFLIYNLYSCDQVIGDKEIICSTIFTTLGVEISGQKLDTFYTVRVSNQDTIWNDFYDGDSYYPVLTDRYHGQLVNSQDSFQFYGFINDSLVVSEPYSIGGDDCHIYYISGKKSLAL